MSATKEHNKEQSAVRVMLLVLEGAATKISAGYIIEPRHLDKVLDFFENFVNRYRLLKEYQQERFFIRGMRVALKQLSRGADEAAPEFSKNARSFVALLRKHLLHEKARGDLARQEFGPAGILGAGQSRLKVYGRYLKNLKGIYLVD